MTDFQTGLMISVIGLVVTFTSLGIFIGIIVLLKKLFPVKAKKTETKVATIAEPAEAIIQTEDDSENIAAALAAVTYLRSRRTGQLGAALLSGPGPFRTSR